MKKKIFWVSDYYKEVFGQKVYKISLDAGCTCPTRDGTKGVGGCIFCSPSGSGDFAADRNLPILQQINQAKELVKKKYKGNKFIAYFQNYTNTYGNQKHLIGLFNQAAHAQDIVGIAVATRPDCIQDEMLEYLNQLSKETYVSVELGLQTCDSKTAQFINRGYENYEYIDCMEKLKKYAPKIHIVTHCIFGLPYETQEQMIETVKFCVNAGTHGIKITVLHVLKGTKLEQLYNQNKFNCLSMQEYFNLLAAAIDCIPPNVVVHRLTGDGPKKLLIAPLWTCDKKQVHNKMMHFLKEKSFVL